VVHDRARLCKPLEVLNGQITAPRTAHQRGTNRARSSDDGEVAELEEGSMRIDIIRPVNSDRLWVTIILPAGSLRLLMPCADLAEAAGIEEDEVA
jgi:hypothetical protein